MINCVINCEDGLPAWPFSRFNKARGEPTTVPPVRPAGAAGEGAAPAFTPISLRQRYPREGMAMMATERRLRRRVYEQRQLDHYPPRYRL